MSRVFIVCGGTGGHMAPGIAIAEGLAAAGHSCLLLISEKKIDSRLMEKYRGVECRAVPGYALSGGVVGLLRFAVGLVRGLLAAYRLVRAERPDLVVGFGGFTNVAVALAAWSCHVPVALHEANRVPGRSVRYLAWLARRVFLPPGVSLGGFGAKVRPAGLPVRREIKRVPRNTARERFGFDTSHKLLLVLGGSQGARTLNDWVKQNLEGLALEGIQVCCITGLGRTIEGGFEHRTRDGGTVRARFLPFCDQMAELICAADLVVTRAGAGTLAELIRCQVPAVLVPYPHAADDHQRANAEFFERQGGGIVLREPEMGRLKREVVDMIFSDWLLAKFRDNLRRMDREEVTESIVRDLGGILEEGRRAPAQPAPRAA